MATSEKLLRIRSLNDLRKYKDLSQSVLMTKHLYIECDIDEIYVEIEDICRKSLVYSIITTQKNKHITCISSIDDTVPIFIAANEDAAYNLVSELICRPFQTIMKAINADSVILNYLPGRPT